jgi:hypothetical protein
MKTSKRKKGKYDQYRKLCKNNVYVLPHWCDKNERELISTWCYENLNGIHCWLPVGEYMWTGEIIGFHNKWDLVAFKLRWGE